MKPKPKLSKGRPRERTPGSVRRDYHATPKQHEKLRELLEFLRQKDSKKAP